MTHTESKENNMTEENDKMPFWLLIVFTLIFVATPAFCLFYFCTKHNTLDCIGIVLILLGLTLRTIREYKEKTISK